MGKTALSDGVIAIIITIMVLELKVPHGASFDARVPLWPVFLRLRARLHLHRDLLEQAPVWMLPIKFKDFE